MSKMCYIYTLSDMNNNIRYVGQTSCKLSSRKANHKFSARKENNNLRSQNWIRKVLKNQKDIQIQLIDIVGLKEVDYWETYWIAQFRTWGFNLTNIEDGGGGFGPRFGVRNGMFRKNHTIETRKKLSNTRKILFQEGKLGTREGQKNSKEHRRKHSETRKKLFKEGKLDNHFFHNNPSKGKPAHNRRKIVKLDFEGNIIKEYDYTMQVSEDGYIPGNVRRCCKGKTKQYKGFKWEYVN